jgi:hypothetical protein
MTTDKKPVPWRLILIFAILVIIMFLLGRYCGTGKKVIVDTVTADSAIIIKKAKAEQYTVDSTIMAARQAEHDKQIAKTQAGREALTFQILKQEQLIKKLSGATGYAPVDTGYTLPDSCKGLADAAIKLVELNEQGRIKQKELDLQLLTSRAVSDSILAACEAERLSSGKLFNTLAETYQKLKKENQRSTAALYAGFSGIYNPVTQGVGGTLMFKTGGNTLYGAAYYITNNKPLYEIRVLKKLSFRRK